MHKHIAIKALWIIVFCFYMRPLYSQASVQESYVTPEMILNAQQQEKKAAQRKEESKSKKYFQELYAAMAINSNDTTICQQAGDDSDVRKCYSHTAMLFIVKSFVSGECELLQEPQTGLCYGLKNGCASVKNNADMCLAFENYDANRLVKASNAPSWALTSGPVSIDTAKHAIAIYSDLKNRSSSACMKYAGSNSIRRAACKVLSSTKMPQDEFNVIVKNLKDQYK
jgi:hypothetical protein